MSKHYKIVLTIRFFGYSIFLSGLAIFIFMLGPLVSAEINYRKDRILGIIRTVADVVPSTEVSSGPGSFGGVQAAKNQIIPLSTEFGVVIEKINANARVVPNVDAGNEQEYTEALQFGVAQALGSTPPGESGNLYLFSHSTDAPWNIVRYNAVFYLLRELEPGDRVVIFYQDKRYDYIVYDKAVVSPADVSYLTNNYDSPVLTLQTCDPPGTLLNRLVVRAKLVNS